MKPTTKNWPVIVAATVVTLYFLICIIGKINGPVDLDKIKVTVQDLDGKLLPVHWVGVNKTNIYVGVERNPQ